MTSNWIFLGILANGEWWSHITWNCFHSSSFFLIYRVIGLVSKSWAAEKVINLNCGNKTEMLKFKDEASSNRWLRSWRIKELSWKTVETSFLIKHRLIMIFCWYFNIQVMEYQWQRNLGVMLRLKIQNSHFWVVMQRKRRCHTS